MIALGSAMSTMTSRQPFGVFCASRGCQDSIGTHGSTQRTSKTWIGSASKNSCAMMTVNSSLAGEGRDGQLRRLLTSGAEHSQAGTSSTLPHQLTGISPKPPFCSFFLCSSLSASEFSMRWIEVTGGEECAGRDLKVCEEGWSAQSSSLGCERRGSLVGYLRAGCRDLGRARRSARGASNLAQPIG